MKRDAEERKPEPIGEKLLTLQEAAAVLRMHPRTVRAYVRSGELEGRIIGARWRFRRESLDRFYANAPKNWEFCVKRGDGD